MSGNKALLDSNTLIYLSKGVLDIELMVNDYQLLSLSIVSYMEVLGFDFKSQEEKALIKEIIQICEMIPISYEIADKVVEIRAILKGKLPDLIVGVSALMSGCDLITHNVGDFQHISPSLKIIDPFLKYKVV